MPLVNCYNRGCGQQFDIEQNDEDVCRHHPGMPFFHDAYKGWSCCNKKCIDFTEFLNIKGCTLAKHSNVKPPEPVKPKVDEDFEKIPIEVKMPSAKVEILKRPPFDTPLIALTPKIAPSLKQKSNCPTNTVHSQDLNSNEIIVGTKCKNGGCKGEYEGTQSNTEDCIHHPGVPIFHEGLKYWSCCQKKTTDFSAFLNQAGCTTGVHKWKNEASSTNTVKCRWDWHQTGNNVIVAVYAKEYDPDISVVKINPIRLFVNLGFPKENGASFNMDLELRGIIDVDQCRVEMFGTKIEVTLKKAEVGSWSFLDFPKPIEKKTEEKVESKVELDVKDEDDLDLDDVEPIPQFGHVNISEVLDEDD